MGSLHPALLATWCFFVVWCVLAVHAIPRTDSDSRVNGFWITRNEKGRESASMITSQGADVKCTFDYSTFPPQEATTKAEKELPPSEILARYMTAKTCLGFKNDHGYTLCIGANATQVVDNSNTNAPILLGRFKGWNSHGEQIYEEGNNEHCSIPRSFTVQFTCEQGLRIVSVSEPTICKYHFVVGVPEACGHRVFSRASSPADGLETWYMEIFETPEAIGCVVHAAGFGLPSPIDSGVISDFSLKLEKGKNTLGIASFEARHGQRQHFSRREINTQSGVLQPLRLPLPAPPNYLAISSTSTTPKAQDRRSA